ncbi:MAG: cation transporter [Prevotella sp.]|nr:cation transporter [Prevotella sp.]
MKKSMMMLTMLLVACVTFAKDIKTVVLTTMPQMHCESCENKIKGNLRFEKGIKSVETNIDEQAVTVQYDADKTNEEKIMKAFGKFGYQASKKEAAKQDCKQCDKKDAKHCEKEGQCGKCEQGKQCDKKDAKHCEKEGQCGKCEQGKQCDKAEGKCCKAEGQCEKAEGKCGKCEQDHACEKDAKHCENK